MNLDYQQPRTEVEEQNRAARSLKTVGICNSIAFVELVIAGIAFRALRRKYFSGEDLEAFGFALIAGVFLLSQLFVLLPIVLTITAKRWRHWNSSDRAIAVGGIPACMLLTIALFKWRVWD